MTFRQIHPQDVNPSNVEKAFRRPAAQARLKEVQGAIEKNPSACHVPHSPYMRIRDNGKLLRVWMRHLVWYALHGEISTFAPTTCGTPGCVNPAHQMKLSDYMAAKEARRLEKQHPAPSRVISTPSALQRLSDAERRIGELESRLGVAAVHDVARPVECTDDGSISSL